MAGSGGFVLSVVWVLCVSMWFFQHVPEVNAPGIASVYPSASESLTLSGANVELKQNGLVRRYVRGCGRAGRGWRWGPILVVWPLIYVLVWTVRWIRRGFQQRA